MTLQLDLTPPSAAKAPIPSTAATQASRRRLCALLFGQQSQTELPGITDLASACLLLAQGSERKLLLPLAESPREIALVRRGTKLLVSEYGTESVPEVHHLDQPTSLRAVLDACSQALLAEAEGLTGARREIHEQLAAQVRHAKLAPIPTEARSVTHRGGRATPPREGVALAFGYEVQLVPGAGPLSSRSARADIHATFFTGTLWAYVRGRRVPLLRGPVLLAVQRMVVAVRVLVDAWDSGRPAHVRLRAGRFHVAVRLDAERRVALSLAGEGAEAVTAQNLSLADAANPILRLASDLVRAVVSVDRAQGRNLRIRTFRDEVRGLRRAVREREAERGFVNRDPERLRSIHHLEGHHEAPRPEARPTPVRPVRSLRFGERWRIAVDGLDAASTFLCGDRIVIATPRHTVAVGRDRGEVLWVRTGLDTAAFMAGSTLVRASSEGRVELCDVSDGEAFATTHVETRSGAPLKGLMLGGAGIPPMVALTDGAQRVVAIDLRTGQPRWRFSTRSSSGAQLKRVGRMLLVTSPEGTLHAVDASSGDELWCYAVRDRLATAPVVVGERVFLASGALGARRGALHVIDLYSGQAQYTSELDGAPLADPVAHRDGVALAVERDGERRALAFRSDREEARWDIRDPGLGSGAATLAIDGLLVCNTPRGELTAVDTGTGETRWAATLSDSVADDVPRRLEPVLRGGALFVPSSSVHVLRPHDGSPIGEGLRCELVPDWIRVDERGWVFVAEESGHVNAHAPVPHLELVHG